MPDPTVAGTADETGAAAGAADDGRDADADLETTALAGRATVSGARSLEDGVAAAAGHRPGGVVIETRDELTEDTDRSAAPRLPDGRTPRGLRPDGTVRTTGWLQVGERTVASPVAAALVTLVVVAALVVVAGPPIVVALAALVLGPVAAFGLWTVETRRFRPASRALTLPSTPVTLLLPGDWIRTEGSIGPAGQVLRTRPDGDGGMTVRLVGGRRLDLPVDARVPAAQLLD